MAVKDLRPLRGARRTRVLKGAANAASVGQGVFREFYLGLLKKGMRPEMARLTLARKIAAIALKIWKKGESFDANHLKSQAAYARSACRNAKLSDARFDGTERSGSRVSIHRRDKPRH